MFSVCIRVVICLTSQFEEKQYLHVLLRFVSLVWCGVRVSAVYAFKKKKGEGGGRK